MSSLLERLRWANYYEELSWYRSLIAPSLPANPDYIYSTTHFTDLSGLTGLSATVLQNLTICRFLPLLNEISNSVIYLRGENDSIENQQHSGRSYIDSPVKTRICPKCWSAHQVLLIPWRIKFVTLCPIHRALLVDKCTSCGKSLRIDKAKGVCQNCQLPIGQLQPYSVADHEESLSLSDLIWGILGCNNKPFLHQELPVHKEHPVCTIKPAVLLAFLWHSSWLLGEFIGRRGSNRSGLLPQGLSDEGFKGRLFTASTVQVHCTLVKAWQMLLYWPKEWFPALSRLMNNEVVASDSYLAKGLLSQYSGEQWNWFWEGWGDFVADVLGCGSFYSPDSYEYFSNAKGRGFTLPSLLSYRETANHLGVPQARVAEFVASGQLRAVVRHSVNSKRFWELITADSVEQLLQHRGKSETIPGILRLFHLTHSQLYALVKAKILFPEAGSDSNDYSNWCFNVETAHACLSHFVEHFPIRQFPYKELLLERENHLWTFDRICNWMDGGLRGLDEVFIDMIDGRLPMSRANKSPIIQGLWCHADTFGRYFSLLREERGGEE